MVNRPPTHENHDSPRRWISLALKRPLIVSANALSLLSPTLPTDGSIPASASRSVYLVATY